MSKKIHTHKLEAAEFDNEGMQKLIQKLQETKLNKAELPHRTFCKNPQSPD